MLYKSFIVGASHEQVCTPFVTYSIGDSFDGISGHTFENSSLDTAPCNLLTPFFFPAILRASIPISKPDWLISAFGSIPNLKNSSFDRPSLSQYLSKYFSTKLSGNISFPAGTGVCVVNTVIEDTISFAISNETSLYFIIFFISSIVKNDECPSFIWYTVGFNPKVYKRFTPPIPRTISCIILISWSPPYRVEVTVLYSGMFSSMSESSKYKVLRPTFICQAFKYIFFFGNFI